MSKLPKTGCKKPSINKIGSELKITTNCTIPKSVVKGTDKGTSTKGTTKKASKSKGTTSIGKYKGVSIGKKAMVLAKSECKGMTGSEGKDCVKRAKENWRSMGKEEKVEYGVTDTQAIQEGYMR